MVFERAPDREIRKNDCITVSRYTYLYTIYAVYEKLFGRSPPATKYLRGKKKKISIKPTTRGSFSDFSTRDYCYYRFVFRFQSSFDFQTTGITYVHSSRHCIIIARPRRTGENRTTTEKQNDNNNNNNFQRVEKSVRKRRQYRISRTPLPPRRKTKKQKKTPTNYFSRDNNFKIRTEFHHGLSMISGVCRVRFRLITPETSDAALGGGGGGLSPGREPGTGTMFVAKTPRTTAGNELD